ncbi:PREDICTED: uncharacterized protein LOC109476339 isoform X2 [Branchiostoma belcheri]|uniref:Uncharacterized protein LOC109476339 isoform X2 n=1 Tax=Branchiostoma belcheri TaxID=7741 RepID=A0A6P4YTU2_BRABE|nr:PREDICTED: uncharacterized protein LOC109476339 isoform X2 [Branchiostoma belcheri]
MSDKGEESPTGATQGGGDSTSVSSGSTSAVPVGSRVLLYSQKGEWVAVEQVLRGLGKGDPEIHTTEEETGVTPLMIAVRENKLVVAERLLELGANLNDRAKVRYYLLDKFSY